MPRSPVAVNLPKYLPDVGFQKKNPGGGLEGTVLFLTRYKTYISIVHRYELVVF